MVLNEDLLQQLFGEATLDHISKESIGEVAEKYPYFIQAHWISAIKQWQVSHNGESLTEAAVYAFHPARLKQYFLEKPVLSANFLGQNGFKGEEDIGATLEQPSESMGTGEENESFSSTPQPESDLPPFPDLAAKENETQVQNETDQEGKEEKRAEPSENLISSEQNDEYLKEETPSKSIIQPLFTQDYFAFTGTGLPENVDNDKKPTMEQLRSFTGWLRTMKRSVVFSADPDLEGEKSIANSGEDKNAEQEVVTEAMAEVRATNGQYEKAIAIYEKLSLSNPEKSAYFAQKIEALKNK